jgi:hypothetical protein
VPVKFNQEDRMSEVENLRDTLSRISQLASAASGEVDETGGYGAAPAVCTPKSLPAHLQVRAARTAREVFPANAPFVGFLPEDEGISRAVSDPLAIAVLTSKYWGSSRRRLTVSFMETTPSDLRNRILSHMNAWQCGVDFVFTAGTGQVRISRGAGGYYSYLGTDVLHIATNRQTMNLQNFTMSTPESEFRRVVRHETGHTLGFPHEHMRRELVARIDPQKAYDYFRRTQGWNRTTVDQQVLTPLDDRSIFATPPDQTSIMCYQLPGIITRDGRPILGGADINATDRGFCLRIYPRPGAAPAAEYDHNLPTETEDESTFVEEPVLVG